jgi:isoquinoline 1-oxidoreductase beta subunit
VEISRAIGKPIQVIWTRSDDMRHGFFHPMDIERIAGGLDADGRPVVWLQRSVGSNLSMYGFPNEEQQKNPRLYFNNGSPWGSFDNPYNFPNLKADFVPLNSPVPTGPWRAVEYPPTVFARESFLDEMAHLNGQDPLDFRLRLLEPRNILEIGDAKIDRQPTCSRAGGGGGEGKLENSSRFVPMRRRSQIQQIGCGAAESPANVYDTDSYMAQVADVFRWP